MKQRRGIIRMVQKALLVVLVSGLAALLLGAAPAPDVAIKGYDPAAYFTVGKPLQGSDANTFQWHGFTWHFASQEHRDLFAASPEKYAPQYDGYCAWAMTESRKAITDPEVWRIVDGKLYLNCSKEAYEKWIRDIPGHIEKADRNWRGMQEGK